MSLLVLMVVVAVLDCGQGGKIIQGQISSCKGVFDLYFVLDRYVLSVLRGHRRGKSDHQIRYMQSKVVITTDYI